jgi:glycosyltransferase involved in cell wall biosynthesis
MVQTCACSNKERNTCTSIPVHHFIVVDGYSTDRTVDVVREYFGGRAKVIETKASLGCARYLGMRAVDTEWFAFIDSDVEILPGWFKAALIYEKLTYLWHPRSIQGKYSKQTYSTSSFTEEVPKYQGCD